MSRLTENANNENDKIIKITENKVKSVRKYCEFYTDMAIQSYDWQQYKYSIQALSSVIAARKTWGITPVWNDIFSKITGYSYEDIEECSRKLHTKYEKFFCKTKKPSKPKLSKAKSGEQGILSNSQSVSNLALNGTATDSLTRTKAVSISTKMREKSQKLKENDPSDSSVYVKGAPSNEKMNSSNFFTNPLQPVKSFNLQKEKHAIAADSGYNSQKEGKRFGSKSKGYQATTISMSRKGSVKSIDSNTGNKAFKSFLKQPTKIKLRMARSNDTQNSSHISDKSYRQNRILRKRRKQPSESIDSERNGNTRYGATLRLFNSNSTSKANLSFSSSVVCQKLKKNPSKSKISSNVSHSEIGNETTRINKYSIVTWGATFDNSKDQSKHPKQTYGTIFPRRSSGLLRPKTSIGRNHSLYSNAKKFNNSCVESKINVDHFLSNRSNSEQGNLQPFVTEPMKGNEHHETTVVHISETNGSMHEHHKLTKNYSLKTIFEKKRLNSKDFIKNNINYVNQLSSKVKNE